jgi:hypothetical protein
LGGLRYGRRARARSTPPHRDSARATLVGRGLHAHIVPLSVLESTGGPICAKTQ